MPRVARIVIPDMPHHITQRGNNRQDVFFVDDDRRVYLQTLCTQAARFGLQIEGYCLMTNHVHLIATPRRPDSLAKALGRAHFLYSRYVNRFHGRSGHLWQNRFFSCALDEGHYWTAMCYVERNPVRAGLVRAPWRYEWSSAAEHCRVAEPASAGLPRGADGWGNVAHSWQAHSGVVDTDNDGQFVDETVPSVQYSYDSLGRLHIVTYPTDTRVVYYHYSTDASGGTLGMLANIATSETSGNELVVYTYLGDGTIVGESHPQVSGGLNLVIELDNFGRVLTQKWVNNATPTPAIRDGYSYTYDAAGNRTSRTNLEATGRTPSNTSLNESYTYDQLDRLIQTDRNSLAFQTWNLDQLGNWTNNTRDVTGDGTADIDEDRTANAANEITSVSTQSNAPVYDRSGNLLYDGEYVTYVYDAWNRQVAMARGGSTTTSRFDGRNYRISSGTSTMSHVYYNENWQVLEETLGTTKTQYTWDVRYIDAPVLRWRTANGTTTVAYYLNDANMNVTGLVGTSGAFIERYSYDTYGNPAIYASNWSPVQASMLQTNGNVYFYCGYRLDDGIRYADDYQIVSCTYHIRNREYSTKFMWEQRDQWESEASLYDYVFSDPVAYVDPYGLRGGPAVAPPPARPSPRTQPPWPNRAPSRWEETDNPRTTGRTTTRGDGPRSNGVYVIDGVAWADTAYVRPPDCPLYTLKTENLPNLPLGFRWVVTDRFLNAPGVPSPMPYATVAEDLQLGAILDRLDRYVYSMKMKAQLIQEKKGPKTCPADNGPHNGGGRCFCGGSNGCDDLVNLIFGAYDAIRKLRVTALNVPKAAPSLPKSFFETYNMTRMNELDRVMQAHHMNQQAAFPEIMRGLGFSVKLAYETHNRVHDFLRENFWSQFRENGPRKWDPPTYGEFGKAMEKALKGAGCSPEVVSILSDLARRQRELYGLKEGDKMKVLPSR